MSIHGSGRRTDGAPPRPARRIHAEGPGKLPELAVCPDCGASYRNGRWTWKAAPADAYVHSCPACVRIASRYPAGVVQLRGAFVSGHRDELVRLLRNVAESESADHPLNRIMDVRDDDEGVAVQVTEGRLAEALGRALQRAYEGELDLPPTTAEKQNLVRVRWTRD